MRQAEHVYTPVLNEAQRRRFDALQAEIERTLHEMAATLQRGIALLDAIDAPTTDLEPEVDAGIEDAAAELDYGEDDAELGWANNGSQALLHGSRDELEPTLGATGCVNGTDHLWGWGRATTRALDELEEENEHGGDILDEPQGPGDDEEPSLGSLCGTADTRSCTQLGWAGGHDNDAEEEHDGREEGPGL